MFRKVFKNTAIRVSSEAPKVMTSRQIEHGFDPQDALHSIREYRLRKVASKRIPSRMS